MEPNLKIPSFQCPQRPLSRWQRLKHWRGAVLTGVLMVGLTDMLAISFVVSNYEHGQTPSDAAALDIVPAFLICLFILTAVVHVGNALDLCRRLYEAQIRIADGALVALKKGQERRIPLDKIYAVESERHALVVVGAGTSIAIPKTCLNDATRQFFRQLANPANAIEASPEEVRARLGKGLNLSEAQVERQWRWGCLTLLMVSLLYAYGVAYSVTVLASLQVLPVVLWSLVWVGVFVGLCWVYVLVPPWNLFGSDSPSGNSEATEDMLYYLQQVGNPDGLKVAFLQLVRSLPIPIKGEVDTTRTSRIVVEILKRVLPSLSCDEFRVLDKMEKRMLCAYPDASFFVLVVDWFVRCGSYADVKELYRLISSAGAYGNPNCALAHWSHRQVSLESLLSRVGARMDELGTQQSHLLHPAVGGEKGSEASLLHPVEGGSASGSPSPSSQPEEDGEERG
ncbi:YcxB family protein [Chthonomonas calidirosea]|uniref:YcxB family protein n=1 Tax=Chthonomonas calidirosea TaxID=454171 RepID=UPI0006EC5560|nr:YcxB family protein [Chthonomonas calidirosea]CEK12787.1 hypothetical protein CP488_00201 [Chthonomonas calidirosea]